MISMFPIQSNCFAWSWDRVVAILLFAAMIGGVLILLLARYGKPATREGRLRSSRADSRPQMNS